MDAEILFFMTLKDQEDFFEIAKISCDSVSNNHKINRLVLHVGNCHLLFKSSSFGKDILYSGSLEIRSSSFSSEITTAEKEAVKTVFRKLRNWIKKHYWSRLAYINKNKNDTLTPSRNYWLGPNARCWKEQNTKHILKLSTTSWMVFEIGY